MKIGIISLNINTHDLNYGAILHSWAFQNLLEEKGLNTEIINYTTPRYYGINLKYPMWHELRHGHIKNFIVNCSRFKSHARRFEKFEEFKRTQLKISPLSYSQEKLAVAMLDYDVLICESDVIWSPGFMGGDFDPAFFLALPSMKNSKRIAYAASMANGDFTAQQAMRYKDLLNNLDAISLRESYAVEYTNRLGISNVHAEWVLDPVLLLDPDIYVKITGPRIIQDPYILLYFPKGYDVNIIRNTKKLAKTKGLKVVEVSRFVWDKFSHKTIMDAGVEEFLSLIRYADIVVSNSFHAVCFSIIFKKNFYAFNRKSGKKIEDICNRMGLGNRFVQNILIEQQDIDYEKVFEILRDAKIKSIRFLETSIGI